MKFSSSVTIETYLELAKTVSYSKEKTGQKNAPGSNTLDQYVQQHQGRNTGIFWTLKFVMSKVSLHSFEQLKCLFWAMFTDSRFPE